LDEDLFARGADSLSLLLAIQAVEKELGLRLQLSHVFKHRTVRKVLELALEDPLVLSSPKIKGTPARKEPLQSRNYDAIPLSYNQEHLWFLSRMGLAGVNDAYTIPLKLRFNRCPSVDRLKHAVNKVLMGNAVLRTVLHFDQEAGEAHQRVLSGTECLIHLGPSTVAEGGTVNECSFDLDRDIPVKAHWAHSTLSVVFHHVAVDEHSLRLVASQLSNAYQLEAGGADPCWEGLYSL